MKKFILFTTIVAFIGTIQTLNAQMKSVLIIQEDANKCFQKNRSSALALKELLRLSEEHVLQNIRTETDALGYSHERFEQYYKCGCAGTARRSLLRAAEIANWQSAGYKNISENRIK